MQNIDFKSVLFTYQGRINRKSYWTAIVLYIGIIVVLFALSIMLIGTGTLFYIVLLVVYLPLLVSSVMVGIKRLHDRDKSGSWLLLFYLLPMVLNWLGNTLNSPLLFSLPAFAISIWMIVELGFLPGTSGPNQYGSEPATV